MRIWSGLGVGAAMLLSGCATFVDGSEQYITINTPPNYYAHCLVSRPGQSFNVSTPGSLHISRSGDDLTVRCHRPGYADQVATIPADINLWTAGNLLTGGVTVAVDAWTGAMYEYPDTFDVPMAVAAGEPSPAAYSSTYSLPPPPAPAPTMAAPAPAPDVAPSPTTDNGKPLPGTLPDNY